MTPKEFINKYGMLVATSTITSIHEKFHPVWGFEMSTLGLLIQSYNLVYEHGSVERAKSYAKSIYTAPEVSEMLLKAIKDVEGIHGI